MKLTETHPFCVHKALLLITLISHIAQLLIHRCYYFHAGPPISFKYVGHNHLRCSMMGKVSLET